MRRQLLIACIGGLLMSVDVDAARGKKRPVGPSFGKALAGAKIVAFKQTPQIDLRLHIFEPGSDGANVSLSG